ncbi:hypothetical protein IFM89_039053 [Coptis chinensis]|uniref:DCD domain-containing protein n=1 Tax=Coptis chinensis TaxID=261450 RepID=A0A835M8N9_9MAGN|nr:hypothetical protein IFM89_039053 [Coptis chinensis]
MANDRFSTRNLSKTELGGVIFGCTQTSMRECLVNQLFGLPGKHFLYVQNIQPGLPLFLFNYSDRKLYGLFEAVSQGNWNINPYGWSPNGSERTMYPAQVRVHTRLQCEPLLEPQFKPIIAENYYTSSRFCLDIDRAQASALISLFASSPVIGGAPKWIPKLALNLDPSSSTPLVSKSYNTSLDQSDLKQRFGVTPIYEESQIHETHGDKEQVENEEQLIYLKLEKLALERKHTSSSPLDHVTDVAVPCNTSTENLENGSAQERVSGAADKYEETSTSDLQLVIDQGDTDLELHKLKDRVELLESQLKISTTCVNETVAEPFDELRLSGEELIFLLGGYDGYSFLSAVDCYSPSKDIVRSLQPMSAIRSQAAVAALDGHIYIFGGGNRDLWYDTVECYSPFRNEWTSCPSLSVEKGNLVGATLHGKLFAIGGANRDHCLSDVEMFDPSLGRWVRSQSMLKKRFAPASAEINGAIYVVGGYDGKNYLNSAERFDPRTISWESVPSMKTSRGGHSVVAFNEKIYAFGGFDGTRNVSEVEVLDPRFGSWTDGDSMHQPRVSAGAVVIGESIYVIGGVQSGSNFIDTVEHYKEDSGWLVIKSKAIGKRSFFSAVVV